jgi:hypothetical protein
LIAFLAVLRTNLSSPNWSSITFLPIWVLILFGLRNSLMLLAGKLQAIPMRYRLWETGFLISFFVMLLGGAFIPIPGSYYPEENIWSYNRIKSQMGKIALVSSLPILLVAIVLFLSRVFFPLSSTLESFLSTGFGAAFVFSIADILVPFFPFVSYNGRRLWDWNRWIWGLMAGVIFALWTALLFGM